MASCGTAMPISPWFSCSHRYACPIVFRSVSPERATASMTTRRSRLTASLARGHIGGGGGEPAPPPGPGGGGGSARGGAAADRQVLDDVLVQPHARLRFQRPVEELLADAGELGANAFGFGIVGGVEQRQRQRGARRHDGVAGAGAGGPEVHQSLERAIT